MTPAMDLLTRLFVPACIGIIVALLAWVLVHGSVTRRLDRRRHFAKRDLGLCHVRTRIASGPLHVMSRVALMAAVAYAVLAFARVIADDARLAGQPAMARAWERSGILLMAWIVVVMALTWWIRVRVDRALPVELMACADALELRFLDRTLRIPWRDVSLRHLQVEPRPRAMFVITREVALILPGPWKPVGEPPPSPLERFGGAHLVPMRLRDMPVHDDLVAACGEPVVAAVPLASDRRAAILPAILIAIAMALPLALAWSLERTQAADRGSGSPAPAASHP